MSKTANRNGAFIMALLRLLRKKQIINDLLLASNNKALQSVLQLTTEIYIEKAIKNIGSLKDDFQYYSHFNSVIKQLIPIAFHTLEKRLVTRDYQTLNAIYITIFEEIVKYLKSLFKLATDNCLKALNRENLKHLEKIICDDTLVQLFLAILHVSDTVSLRSSLLISSLSGIIQVYKESSIFSHNLHMVSK